MRFYNPNVSEIDKAFDPAWMCHHPLYSGEDALIALPSTEKRGNIRYFEKPYKVDILEFYVMFDGAAAVEYLDYTKRDCLVYYFITDTTADSIKEFHRKLKEDKKTNPKLKMHLLHIV